MKAKWPAYSAPRAKWRVQKLDGVWCAFDAEGYLRYAGSDWYTVYSFARLGLGPMKPQSGMRLGDLFK